MSSFDANQVRDLVRGKVGTDVGGRSGKGYVLAKVVGQTSRDVNLLQRVSDGIGWC